MVANSGIVGNQIARLHDHTRQCGGKWCRFRFRCGALRQRIGIVNASVGTAHGLQIEDVLCQLLWRQHDTLPVSGVDRVQQLDGLYRKIILGLDTDGDLLDRRGSHISARPDQLDYRCFITTHDDCVFRADRHFSIQHAIYQLILCVVVNDKTCTVTVGGDCVICIDIRR